MMCAAVWVVMLHCGQNHCNNEFKGLISKEDLIDRKILLKWAMGQILKSFNAWDVFTLAQGGLVSGRATLSPKYGDTFN